MEMHLDQLLQEKELDRQELAQLNQRLAIKENVALSHGMEEVTTQLVEYKEKYEKQTVINQSLNMRVEDLNRKLDDLQFSYEEEKILRSDLQADLDMAMKKTKNITYEIPAESMVDLKLSYEGRIIEFHNEIETLKKWIATTEAENSKLKIMANSATSEIKNLEDMIKLELIKNTEQQRDCVKNEKKVNNLLQFKEDLLVKIKQLQASAEESSKAHSNALSEIKGCCDSQIKQIQFVNDDLKQQLKSCSDDKSVLLEAKVELEGQLTSRNNEIELLKNSDQNLVGQITALQELVLEVQRSEDSACVLQRAHLAEIESLKSSRSTLEEQLRKLEEREAVLSNHKAQLELEVMEANERHKGLLGENEKAYICIQDLEAKYRNDVRHIENTTQETITKFQAQIHEFNVENSNLKEKLASVVSGESIILCSELEEKQRQLSDLTANKNDLTPKLKLTKDKNLSLMNQIIEAEAIDFKKREELTSSPREIQDVLIDLKQEGTKSCLETAKSTQSSSEIQKTYEIRVGQLESSLKELKDNLKSVEDRENDLIKEKIVHEADITKKRQEYEVVQKEKEKLSNELKLLEEKLRSDSEIQVDSVRELRKNFEEETNKLKSAVTLLTTQVNEFEEREIILVNENELFKADLRNSHHNNEALVNERDMLIGQVNVEKRKAECHVNIYTNKIKELTLHHEQRISKLECTNSTVNEELKVLKGVQAILSACKNKLEAELEIKENELLTKIKVVQDLTSELRNIEQKTIDEKKIAEELFLEFQSKMAVKVEEAEASNITLQEEVKKLRDTEIRLSSSNKDLEIQLEAKSVDLVRMIDEKKMLIDSQCIQQSEHNAKSPDGITDLLKTTCESQVQQLELVNKSLKDQIQNLMEKDSKEVLAQKMNSDDLKRIHEYNETLKTEYEKLSAQLKELSIKSRTQEDNTTNLSEAFAVEIGRVEAINQQLKEQVQSSAEREQVLSYGISRLEGELKQKDDEVKSLQAVAEQLSNKLEILFEEKETTTSVVGEGERCAEGTTLAKDKQVEFLNSIIVDLKLKNEQYSHKLAIFLSDVPLPDHNRNVLSGTSKPVSLTSPRFYCDICEEFDLHDTDDCPRQCNADETTTNSHHHEPRGSVRDYCTSCEGKRMEPFRRMGYQKQKS